MILLPATIEGISTRKDRTVRVTIGTQELAPDKAGQLMALQNALCFVAIKPEMFTKDQEIELEKLRASEVNGKTKAQILRSVLFLNWRDKDKEGFKTSEQHYDYYMDKFTDHMKNKLD
jgi:hypothetical protein